MGRKIKVLYVDALLAPNAKPNVEGMAAAYRKVSELKTFNYRQENANPKLIETALAFKPDLIHLGKCERISGSTVRSIKERLSGCVVVHFYGDFRKSAQKFVVDIGREADWLLLQHDDPRKKKMYLGKGVRRVGCWRAGTNPSVYRPYKLKKIYDLVFMANNANFLSGHKTRRQLISALAASGIKVHLFGKGWKGIAKQKNVFAHSYVSGGKFAQACSQARITLGCGAINDFYLYTSWPRPLNSMASGAFHLTHYFPGLEKIFENRKHLVWFRNVEECVKLARFYLSHPEKRRRIAAAGYKEVLARNTWDHRIAWMLKYYKEALDARH